MGFDCLWLSGDRPLVVVVRREEELLKLVVLWKKRDGEGRLRFFKVFSVEERKER